MKAFIAAASFLALSSATHAMNIDKEDFVEMTSSDIAFVETQVHTPQVYRIDKTEYMMALVITEFEGETCLYGSLVPKDIPFGSSRRRLMTEFYCAETANLTQTNYILIDFHNVGRKHGGRPGMGGGNLSPKVSGTAAKGVTADLPKFVVYTLEFEQVDIFRP